MATKKLLFCLAILAAVSSAFAQAESRATRESVEQFFNRHDKIIGSGTLAQYFNLFTKDWVMVDKQGNRMGLAEYKKLITQMSGNSRNVRSTTLVKNVQLQTQEASVWVLTTMSWEERSGSGWARKSTSMRSCETLVRSGNSWKFKYSQELFTDEPWTFKTNGG